LTSCVKKIKLESLKYPAIENTTEKSKLLNMSKQTITPKRKKISPTLFIKTALKAALTA
jgi:hypothetical protein